MDEDDLAQSIRDGPSRNSVLLQPDMDVTADTDISGLAH